MTEDFLAEFLGNRNRARIVRSLVFSQAEPLTLREMEKRASVSKRVLQKELRTLESIGIIRKGKNVPAPKKAWKAQKKSTKTAHAVETTWLLDLDFKYSKALSMFVKEVAPAQHRVVLDTLKRVGKLSTIVLSGVFVGDPSRPADLLLAGDTLNERRLDQAIRTLEPKYGHEIRYATFSTPEFQYRLTIEDRLIRDTLDYPHVVLLDRTRLL